VGGANGTGGAPSASGLALEGGTVKQIATLPQPREVAVDGDAVYVASLGTAYGNDHPGVVRIPKAGGPPVLLADAGAPAYAVVLDEEHAYYAVAGFGTDTIQKVPKAGGTPMVFDAGVHGGVMGLAVDATHVYASYNTIEGTLIAFDKVTGEWFSLGPTVEGGGGVAVDDAWVYWGKNGGPHVGRTPKKGGPAEPLGTVEAETGSLAVDASRLYVGRMNSAAWSMLKSGGAPQLLEVGSSQGYIVYPTILALDATHVYFTGPPDRPITKIPKAGGQPLLLADVGVFPSGIAVDASGVYFTHTDSGAVWRYTPP
jgi:hypothetical protein